MTRSKRSTTKVRGNSLRARLACGDHDRAAPKTKTAPPGVVADHADVIHDLLGCERTLTDALERTRARLDVELIAAQASRAPSKELAHALQERVGGLQTADELERVARLLRMRTTIAHRRAAKGVGKSDVGDGAQRGHDRPRNPTTKDTTMTHDPYLRRRIIEEFGPPPDGAGSPMDEGHVPALGRSAELVGHGRAPELVGHGPKPEHDEVDQDDDEDDEDVDDDGDEDAEVPSSGRDRRR